MYKALAFLAALILTGFVFLWIAANVFAAFAFLGVVLGYLGLGVLTLWAVVSSNEDGRS